MNSENSTHSKPVPLDCALGARYRLLNNDDVIRADDEMLLDDCTTWEPVGDGPTVGEHWMNGQKYATNLFVPMRRSY